MEHVVDARGLSCPLPFAMAKVALETIDAEDVLVVLATDPEAPIDLAALASGCGRAFECEFEDGAWRIELS